MPHRPAHRASGQTNGDAPAQILGSPSQPGLDEVDAPPPRSCALRNASSWRARISAERHAPARDAVVARSGARARAGGARPRSRSSASHPDAQPHARAAANEQERSQDANDTNAIGVADLFRDQPVRVQDFDRAAIWTASEMAVTSAKLDLSDAGRTEAVAKAREPGGNDWRTALAARTGRRSPVHSRAGRDHRRAARVASPRHVSNGAKN